MWRFALKAEHKQEDDDERATGGFCPYNRVLDLLQIFKDDTPRISSDGPNLPLLHGTHTMKEHPHLILFDQISVKPIAYYFVKQMILVCQDFNDFKHVAGTIKHYYEETDRCFITVWSVNLSMKTACMSALCQMSY